MACRRQKRWWTPLDQAAPRRRQPVFFVARHLAEGAPMSVGEEHRVVAKTPLAPRRPNQRAVDAALELLEVTVRPGDAQRRNEMRCSLIRRGGTMAAKFCV